MTLEALYLAAWIEGLHRINQPAEPPVTLPSPRVPAEATPPGPGERQRSAGGDRA